MYLLIGLTEAASETPLKKFETPTVHIATDETSFLKWLCAAIVGCVKRAFCYCKLCRVCCGCCTKGPEREKPHPSYRPFDSDDSVVAFLLETYLPGRNKHNVDTSRYKIDDTTAKSRLAWHLKKGSCPGQFDSQRWKADSEDGPIQTEYADIRDAKCVPSPMEKEFTILYSAERRRANQKTSMRKRFNEQYSELARSIVCSTYHYDNDAYGFNEKAVFEFTIGKFTYYGCELKANTLSDDINLLFYCAENKEMLHLTPFTGSNS